MLAALAMQRDNTENFGLKMERVTGGNGSGDFDSDDDESPWYKPCKGGVDVIFKNYPRGIRRVNKIVSVYGVSCYLLTCSGGGCGCDNDDRADRVQLLTTFVKFGKWSLSLKGE